jgi:outer membrane protein assembly factor BamB
VAWSKERGGTYMPTPIVYGDLFYTLNNNGVLDAYDARTGEGVYRQRAAERGGAAFTASPVAADGKLYLASEDGDVYVVRAGREFERLAVNPVGEVMMATPALSEGVLYLRTTGRLIAIAEQGAPEAEEATAEGR